MNKNIKLMSLINLFSELKFYGVIAILYYNQIAGSMFLGMSVYSIITISSSIFEFPTGLISDKIGRKYTVILGAFFNLLSSIVLAIGENYITLIVYAIIGGIGIAFFSGNNQAYIYDILESENNKNKFDIYIGKVNSTIYLAGAIAALIGTILVFFTSYKFVICLSILPIAIHFILAFFLDNIDVKKEEKNILEQAKNSILEVKNNKLLKKQIIADSINDGVSEACFQFRSALYELVWPMWALGIPGIISNIGAFLSNWFGGKIIKKYGKIKMYNIASIYSILSNVLGALIKNVFSPIVMITNSIFSIDIIQMDIEQSLYNSEYRASMGSIKSLIKNLLFSIIAMVLGKIADMIGVVYALAIFQMIRVIPIYIYNVILHELEMKNT